jgi:hypothetical protein
MKVSDNYTVCAKWADFQGDVFDFLSEKRGRKARFASFLGVPRQRVNEWVNGTTALPGWVVVNFRDWQREENMGWDTAQMERNRRKNDPASALRKCVR